MSLSWVQKVQDILVQWKLVPMMTTSGHQGTLQFFWNGERSLKKSPWCLSNLMYFGTSCTLRFKHVITYRSFSKKRLILQNGRCILTFKHVLRLSCKTDKVGGSFIYKIKTTCNDFFVCTLLTVHIFNIYL